MATNEMWVYFQELTLLAQFLLKSYEIETPIARISSAMPFLRIMKTS